MVKKLLIITLLLINGSYLYARVQMPDIFIYNGDKYRLLAIGSPNTYLNIFSLDLLGIKPSMLHTACTRGYIATFTTNEDNKLILNQLYTNNGNNINNEIPLINGILPRITTPERLIYENSNYRIWNYNDIGLLINYTGSLIISLNRENRTEIIKLNFINGELINTQDVSSQNWRENHYIINWSEL